MTDYFLVEPESQCDYLHFVLVTPYVFHREKYLQLEGTCCCTRNSFETPRYVQYVVMMIKQFVVFDYSGQKL